METRDRSIFCEVGGGWELGEDMRTRMAFEGGPSQNIMEKRDLDKTQLFHNFLETFKFATILAHRLHQSSSV